MKPTKHKNHSILPPQYVGGQTGAEAQTTLNTREEARILFDIAKRRLLDINSWHEHGSPAKFTLTDASGTEVARLPQVGDLLQIDLPGPGTTSGDGYDWVVIEQFDENIDTEADTEFFAFRVRPVPAPTSSDTKPSHFFTQATTSTFILQRVGTRVTACEKGRNEIPNTGTESTIDNIRNTAVAVAATLGVSVLQWKSLMEGLIKNDKT